MFFQGRSRPGNKRSHFSFPFLIALIGLVSMHRLIIGATADSPRNFTVCCDPTLSTRWSTWFGRDARRALSAQQHSVSAPTGHPSEQVVRLDLAWANRGTCLCVTVPPAHDHFPN